MASKKFTEEEMNHLRASSYVLEVSPSIVHFSAEFKKKFWEAILAGKTPRNIVINLGIGVIMSCKTTLTAKEPCSKSGGPRKNPNGSYDLVFYVAARDEAASKHAVPVQEEFHEFLEREYFINHPPDEDEES